jgi:hypothetical protein
MADGQASDGPELYDMRSVMENQKVCRSYVPFPCGALDVERRRLARCQEQARKEKCFPPGRGNVQLPEEPLVP